LRENAEAEASILYVFSDAPRDVTSAKEVEQVRAFLGRIEGFKKIELTFHSQNQGLAGNIAGGISDVLKKHDSLIVVEDDLVVSPFFLRFMNEALAFYKNERRVGSISGFCYPICGPETYFIRGADCWGWATWQDRWRHYNPNGSALLAQLEESGLVEAFDYEGAMGYSRMLRHQVEGKIDSWAVRWHASCFLRNLLILYPGRTLVQNIGNDGSGTHTTSAEGSYTSSLSSEPIAIKPVPVEQDPIAREAIRSFFLKRQPPQFFQPSEIRTSRDFGSSFLSWLRFW
jgi:hypothetical protein